MAEILREHSDSLEDLKTLYDPKSFKGVGSQTRTDIINTINYDIEGLTQEEGGEFTYQELCNGLHYLIATNKDLHAYIERNKSQASSSDPFIIPSSKLRDLGIDLLISQPISCLAESPFEYLMHLVFLEISYYCLGDEMREPLIAFVLLYVLAVTYGLCQVIYKNIRDMLKNEEPSVVKIAKIITNLIFFIGVTVAAWFYIPSIYFMSSVYVVNSVLAFFCGTVAAALFSYVNKKMLCFPNKQENPPGLIKPSEELLKELEVTKGILQYVREGDDKEICMEFVKAVVRLHIKSISKLEDVENSLYESASSVGGHGSFFPMQSANDADKRIEDSPTCSVQNNG
ncbi:hypothetical protein [Rickettsiella endosymbiont of Dermanyssus gallinae]|uniref:hypothetical protein n=1 Tax=Rickettsiella endosymbiont of Dermanyssus gallinae TaxID=2856608 RepID=UPI001C527879|nr:hypothetical protein [Rickettsiella endosymbiont of Dermanyssus gallinae]